MTPFEAEKEVRRAKRSPLFIFLGALLLCIALWVSSEGKTVSLGFSIITVSVLWMSSLAISVKWIKVAMQLEAALKKGTGDSPP
ncbi:MAG: hypothetical protein ACYTHN_24435 [Planctomycetota bacterium]|jgi:hypothetical protein